MSTEQAGVVTGYPLAAVVYPVPAPHPHQHTNPNPNPSRAALFLLTLTAIISLLFFLATMLVFVSLIFHPSLPKFRVNSLLVSGFNATSSSQISGNWTARFTVFNPNTKMQAFYEVLEGYVYYNDQPLAHNLFPPFHQGTLSVTSLSTTMVATAADVHDWVVPAVNSDRSHGSVKFGVRIAAVVRFRSRAWKTRGTLVKIHCDNLAVAMPANATGGMLFGDAQNCNVYL